MSSSLAVSLPEDNPRYWFLMNPPMMFSSDFWKEAGVISRQQHYLGGKLASGLVVWEAQLEIYFTKEKTETWRIKTCSASVAEGSSVLNTGHVTSSAMLSFSTMGS